MRRSDVVYNARVLTAMSRRKLLRFAFLGVWLLVASAVLLDRATGPGATADHARFHQKTVTLVRVIDGDTIVIEADGREERVRLLGIDAAETNAADNAPPDFWADEATAALRGLLAGGEVTLMLPEIRTRDRYDRLLAYVWAGDVEANLALVEQGAVYADRRHDHERRDAYERAESQARRRDVGLWAEVREDQMPDWRQRWLAER
ncbi:MAG: thermonuclease family protein [Phycisphaerae bacterium]